MPNSDSSRFWIAAEVLLAATMVVLPLSLGGAPEWTLWLLFGLSVSALTLWLLGASRNHRRWGWHWVLLGPTLIAGVALVQLLPLPPELLTALSPRAAQLREFTLVPLGLNAWRPVSVDAPSTARGLGRVVALGMLLFVALELGRLPHVRRRLFGVLALSGATTALIGLGHLLAGADALFGLYSYYGYVPLLSTFGNVNHFAAWLLLSGTVAAGLAMHAETRDSAVGWGVVALVCGVGVFFTFSRGGIASFVATWALVGASVLARRGGGVRQVLPWVLIGGTVLIAVVLSFEQLIERAETLSSLEKFKATKIELWPMFAEGLRPYWLLGAGLGAFELAMAPSQTTEFTVTFTHPEMLGLQWVSDLGLPLTVLVAGFAVWLVWRLWPRLVDAPTERTALIGLIGLAVHDVFDFALELNAVAPAAIIVLGLLCSMDDGRPRIAVRKRGLWAGLAPVVVGLGALSWGIPGHLSAERGLADLVKRGTAYREVRAQALRHIDRHPADWVLYANAARVAAERAPPLEALAWINRVLFLRPSDSGSHVAAARALLRLGKPAQALAELKLAWSLGESGSLELGLSIAAREEAWDRVLLSTRGHLERCYWHLRNRNRNEEAAALLAAARELPPSEDVGVEAAVLSVRHEADLGNPGAALALLEQLPEGLRASPELVMTRVLALGRLGRQDEAARALEQLLARDPSHVNAGFMLADLLASQRRPAAARDVLQRLRPFVSSNPHRAASFQREAALWVQEERFPRAIDALQTAIRIEPARADLHYQLARVYEQMGSLNSALDQLRRGRLLDSPEGARAQDAWRARLEAAIGSTP